jgi:AraC-like DNA-binding protein
MALDIVCAGWESCRSDYLISRTTFPWLALELVVQGEGWLEMEGKRFRLQTGTLFAYGPGISFRITTDPDRPLLKYFVDFTGTSARQTLSQGPLQPGRVQRALYPQELREIMDRMVVEGTRKSKLSRDIANNYLSLLLQKLHECAPSHSGPSQSRALDSFLKAKALLDRDYAEISRADTAAQKLGITPETLSRLFHRFSNVRPYQYLLRLKMNRAVDLLLGTNLLVKEVGLRSGFDDPFHFSRTFKRLQGTSPEIFRRIHQRGSV